MVSHCYRHKCFGRDRREELVLLLGILCKSEINIA